MELLFMKKKHILEKSLHDIAKVSKMDREYVSGQERDCDQKKILVYLKQFQAYKCESEPIIDIFTNEIILLSNSYYTDGIYEWNDAEIYHYEKYDIKLDWKFINYFEEKDNQEYSNIIFGYLTMSAEYWPELELAGDSISVDKDGIFSYSQYYYNINEKITTTYQIPIQIVNKLQHMIDSYAEYIKFFDRNIDNGSDDGEQTSFIFNGTKIIDWNISYNNIPLLIRFINPEYYKEYLNVIQQENMILKIFKKACKILKLAKINICMDLDNFSTDLYAISNIKSRWKDWENW